VIGLLATRPLPPGEPSRVPTLHGLLWLQQGFRVFTAQPGRWIVVLGLWLWLTIVLPGLLAQGLDYVRQAGQLALRPLGMSDSLGDALQVLPLLAPLAMMLLFPLFFAGLMVGCRAVVKGERLLPRHLLAAFEFEPSRLVTVGGINAMGQILMSAAIAWLIRDRLGDLDLTVPADPQKAAVLLGRLSELMPYLLPVVILQTLLMAALWFTPPLLAFHDLSPLGAVRASTLACTRNAGTMLVYSAAMIVMLMFVGAVSLVMQAGIVFGLIALLVLAAAVTTVIGSIYMSYRDIFGISD
jgi:hypothetical protein